MRRRFFQTHKNNVENLTLVSLEDNNEIYLNVRTIGITGEIEMKVSGDYKWMPNGAVILNKGDFIEYRGTISNISAGQDRIGTFVISKKVNLYGDCTSILKDRMLFNNSLAYLFKNTPVVNIHSTFLPATTLAERCYSNMFNGCTNLTTTPELPATTLVNECYREMFYGCTSLTTAPELPATTLAGYCYQYMFYGCTSLTTAPNLPATTLAGHCYESMFRGCTKLNYIKMLATDAIAEYCLLYWVRNVASSGTFVKNPAMTSLSTGASGIPSGWTVVNDGEDNEGGSSEGAINIDNYLTIEAIEDGLTASLSTNACQYCIDGDGNWKSLAADTTTESINTGHTLSFRGELTPASSVGIGTFTISKKCNLKGNCMSMLFGDNADNNYSLSGKNCAFYKLFYNCTNIVNVSSNFLPATMLATDCCRAMFSGCTALTTAPELPATTLATYCYYDMFNGCTALTTAPELPATALANSCYYYMFSGCTNLTTAPELPATILTRYCYRYMFYNCKKLNYIKMLATDISASGCLNSWVYGVASTGTFVKHPNMTSLPTGTSGIPSGWIVVNDEEESGGVGVMK